MKMPLNVVRLVLIVLVVNLPWFGAPESLAQELVDQPSENADSTDVTATQAPPQPNFDERPWPQKLGIRSAFFARQWPAVDTVVLVPDLPTWLDEIMKWNMQSGRWPVLLEDDYYTRLFVRRFAPKTIIRRPSLGTSLPEDPKELESMVRRQRITSWAGAEAADAGKTINDLFRERNWAPPGIVATSFSDSAWPAAVTLAIARGQLLRTLDANFGEPFSTMDGTNVPLLRSRIEKMFADTGWTWGTLGDQLQTLTLCRDFPTRAKVYLPQNARVNLPGANLSSVDPPVAVTDLICRNADFQRYAICGWLFGDHIRSIYMAMCSVFIDRDSISLFSAYETRSGIEAYRISPAGKQLRSAGYEVVSQTIDRNATLEGWRRLVMGGFKSDVLFMNTSGRNSQLEMALETNGKTSDVPTLTQPLALHMIHSYSLQNPDNPRTIGGRWLDRGVYAYVGSCEEPFISAFRTPLEVVEWIANYAPFLVSARKYQGEMSKPWRVVSIGDPLMLIERPEVNPIVRVDQGRTLAAGESNLRTDVLQQLRTAGTADADTYRDLIFLNQDDLALSLWERDNDEAGSEESEAILPLLFEQKSFSKFVQAYRKINGPSEQSKEMLWTIYQPRISAIDSVIDLEMLEKSLRRDIMASDLRRLMPEIIRLKGDMAARDSVIAAIEMATTAGDQNRIRGMLEKY